MKFWFLSVLCFCSFLLIAQDKPAWQQFKLSTLIDQQEQSGKIYLPFLREPSISAGIYELKTGATDNQQPHERDEVYFILRGKSEFTVEHETTEVQAGDVLFVKAHLAHHFSKITEDLKILVWFSGSKNTDHDFLWKKWTSPELAIPQSDENTWNVFLKVPSLITGLYALPSQVGGDSVLTHEVDHINYVISGSGKMIIGAEEIEVEPGSIVYVKQGEGHRFYGIKDDLVVYIMFEQP